MAGSIENRLSELGIELPKVARLLANYIPFVVTGNLVFVSGQLPMWNGELITRFKLDIRRLYNGNSRKYVEIRFNS